MAKANYARGVIARTLPAGRKEEAKFSGSAVLAAGSGRLRGSGGCWGEGARVKRGWGRFGVRGWLHTKEQAAGRRYDAESQSPWQPSDKRAREAAVGARRKRLRLPQPRPLQRGEREPEHPCHRGRLDRPTVGQTHPTAVKPSCSASP